jgi:hypothetical protein
MTADIPSVLSKDGIDGLGAVLSVLEESRTDGTVDNTDCLGTLIGTARCFIFSALDLDLTANFASCVAIRSRTGLKYLGIISAPLYSFSMMLPAPPPVAV